MLPDTKDFSIEAGRVRPAFFIMYWTVKTKNLNGEIKTLSLKGDYTKERILEILSEVWDCEVVSLEPDHNVDPENDPTAPQIREDVMEVIRANVKPGN